MPASARQIAANRCNGAKGGPKTAHGRAAVRFNALQHGLAAEEIVLPGEDGSGYEELRAALLADLAPANTYQRALAEEIVRAYWRLVRLRRVETAVLKHHIEIRSHLQADAAMAQAFMEEPPGTFRTYFRYDTAIERSYYRALQQYDREQRKQLSDNGIRFVPQPAPSPLIDDRQTGAAPAQPAGESSTATTCDPKKALTAVADPSPQYVGPSAEEPLNEGSRCFTSGRNPFKM